MLRWLQVIINCVWISEKIPDDWRGCIILPFWKRKGDRLTCANHRGITLLSISGTLLALVILRRSVSAVRSRRRIQQAGFMPGRSTIDQIFALRQIIKNCNAMNITGHYTSRFKAAFDSIDRICLWDLIRISGTPPKLCRLLELLYSDSESCVRVGNDLSEWFSIASGVRQGCVVAPDLFNCGIDHLMCQLKTVAGPSLGIELDNWRLTDMDYADDIALFSPSSEDLSSVLRIFSK